ncbi:MBL fold metallo-hydrolase [Dysgonomonas sp. GY617]|uniref:MBL fold metallo-hydrolase n=1 Tax=Dysgonomonas sp. GY617 TaxID=2780420 RepID=UPI00188403C1|nr:MBL fold metallo-hydrolase [Dysgonomonas sp. GY617]MBF0577088.1 MBL fold metallo-hydrolase [Dysgonomonas sp. GY617]
MRVRFLGTGTSTGVPEIGCECDVCRSTDKRDNRLRASVIVYIEGKSILIDCGPDFREQMLGIAFLPIDALLITHEHYDHVGGIDDLRPFCKFGDIEIYLEQYVSEALKSRIPYCFTEYKYPGIPIIALNEISLEPFKVAGKIEIIPIRLMHGTLPIVGYRIGNFAYLTDLKTIPEEEYHKLEGLDVLVINALRIREHISHQNLDQALEKIKRIAPKRTYLTHMNHHFGLHAEMEKILPENVFVSFDGLELDIL